ncbi:MAG: hypothetical protein OES46_08480 [Gammaproteobacteria bacterium]|jgi:hypothetical protein|nr:hypothetical protein [Gammaproteobacteria bacterium]
MLAPERQLQKNPASLQQANEDKRSHCIAFVGMTYPDYQKNFENIMIDGTVVQISHNKFIVLLNDVRLTSSPQWSEPFSHRLPIIMLEKAAQSVSLRTMREAGLHAV